MVATVEPLPGLSFGCRVSGVELGPGMSEADFAVVSAAFEEYALVMLEEQHALTPADEVDLRSRLLRLWPQSQPQDGSGSGSDFDCVSDLPSSWSGASTPASAAAEASTVASLSRSGSAGSLSCESRCVWHRSHTRSGYADCLSRTVWGLLSSR